MINFPKWSTEMIDVLMERGKALDPYPFDQPADASVFYTCHQNDYLRLSEHPEVIASKNKATEETGSGAMASIVYGGDHDYHNMFRKKAAEVAQCSSADCALITSSGWNINVGLIEALAGEQTPIYIDALAHASLFDGARLSSGRMIPLRHNKPEAAENLLSMYGPGIVVIDAFYSTYGSVAPLEKYVELVEKYDSILVLDEAHSFSITGKDGGGLAVEKGLADRVHLRVVSLAKGVGGGGGLVLSNEDMIWFLAHRLRPIIFSSYPAPAQSAGHLKALEIVQREPERSSRTLARAAQFRNLLNENGIDTGPSECQIVSLLFDSEIDACKLYGELRKEGILISVFIYPAVAKGTGLARYSIYTHLSEKDVEHIAEKTIEIMHNFKLTSRYPKRLRVSEQTN